VDDAQLERAAAALYVAENGPWVSGQGITPGGTPWGTTRERELRPEYLRRAGAVLAAVTREC